MLLKRCPHCATAHVHATERFAEHQEGSDPVVQWRVVRCQNPRCDRLILALVTASGEITRLYPAGTFELPDEAPIAKEIRDDFREAGLCLGAGCYKASMVMSRRALQRCLKEQGSDQHNLVDAIDHAVKTNILRKSFHDLATEIRQYGNLGAHPDDDQLSNATHENAEQILEFVRLLIHEFYEVPAAAAKLKGRRTRTPP